MLFLCFRQQIQPPSGLTELWYHSLVMDYRLVVVQETAAYLLVIACTHTHTHLHFIDSLADANTLFSCPRRKGFLVRRNGRNQPMQWFSSSNWCQTTTPSHHCKHTLLAAAAPILRWPSETNEPCQQLVLVPTVATMCSQQSNAKRSNLEFTRYSLARRRPRSSRATASRPCPPAVPPAPCPPRAPPAASSPPCASPAG